MALSNIPIQTHACFDKRATFNALKGSGKYDIANYGTRKKEVDWVQA